MKRSHVKSLAALDNGQKPHQPSCPRLEQDNGWQSLNTVAQRWQDQGLGGSILLCHVLVVHIALSLIFLIYQMGRRMIFLGLQWERGDMLFIWPLTQSPAHWCIMHSNNNDCHYYPLRWLAHFSMSQFCPWRIWSLGLLHTLDIRALDMGFVSAVAFPALTEELVRRPRKRVQVKRWYKELCLYFLQSKQHNSSVSNS